MKPYGPTYKRFSRGFTLMETMLAMGLIAIAVLFVLGVMARFLTVQGSTAAQTAARLLAREILDQAAVVGPVGWSGLKGVRSLTLPNERNATDFHYELKQPVAVRSDPDDQGVLWELEVEVTWWSNAPTTRVERGKLFTSARRVVYIEK